VAAASQRDAAAWSRQAACATLQTPSAGGRRCHAAGFAGAPRR